MNLLVQSRKYVPIAKCKSFWYWLHYTWNFPTRMSELGGRKRIIGSRFFGWEKEREVIISRPDEERNHGVK